MESKLGRDFLDSSLSMGDIARLANISIDKLHVILRDDKVTVLSSAEQRRLRLVLDNTCNRTVKRNARHSYKSDYLQSGLDFI